MAKDDILDAIAYLLRQQTNTIDARTDETVDVLSVADESITVTDTLDSTELNAHPVKWGNPTTGIWNMFTWG